VTQAPIPFLVDTDIFIDYLNGSKIAKNILDSSRHRVYYSIVTKKELFAKQGLTANERRKIRPLLLNHRLLPLNEKITKKFSVLLTKYEPQDLRKSDALVAATAAAQRLPLLTRNLKHYRFILEITLLNLATLQR
jgi:predicted nucleic acid-binding protein